MENNTEKMADTVAELMFYSEKLSKIGTALAVMALLIEADRDGQEIDSEYKANVYRLCDVLHRGMQAMQDIINENREFFEGVLARLAQEMGGLNASKACDDSIPVFSKPSNRVN